MLVLATSLAACAIVVSACGLSSLGTGTNLSDEGGSGGAGEDASGVGDTDAGVVVLDGGGGGASSGEAGGTLPDGAPDPYYSRVTNGLVALYQVEENGGSTLHDSMPSPYDMNIATLGDVTWKPHFIQLKNYTKIANSSTFDKLKAACKTSNELTVEAWVQYASVSGDSQTYGRLVSSEGSSRDFALGNKGEQDWWFAMDNGDDVLVNTANKNLVHTVLVRTNDGNNTLYGYLNGAEVGSTQNTHKPNAMQGFPLVFGNTENGDRGVKADIHLIAFYARALTAAEVKTNFMAGPDPAK